MFLTNGFWNIFDILHVQLYVYIHIYWLNLNSYFADDLRAN